LGRTGRLSGWLTLAVAVFMLVAHPHPGSATALRAERRYPPHKGEGGDEHWHIGLGLRCRVHTAIDPNPSPL